MTTRIVWSTIDVRDFSRPGVQWGGKNGAARLSSWEVVVETSVVRAVGEERKLERRSRRVEARQLLSAVGVAKEGLLETSPSRLKA